MSGPVSSFIDTPASTWVVGGNWTMKVENGVMSSLESNMTWYPTNVSAPKALSHKHTFSNFVANPNQIVSLEGGETLGPKQTIDVNGTMDIGLFDNKSQWPSVPALIKLAGQTITIQVNDSKTGDHFNDYPVYGTITNFLNTTNQSIPNFLNTTNQSIPNAVLDRNYNFENPIQKGNIQNFNVTVSDTSNNNPVSNLTIIGAIVPPSEMDKLDSINENLDNITNINEHISTFTGVTNNDGFFTHSWEINEDYRSGTYTIIIQLSGLNIEKIYDQIEFEAVENDDDGNNDD